MPNSTYASIIALLKTKLEGLVDGNSEPIFQKVYDYPEGEFEDGYPVAVIIENAGRGEVMDTSRNERDFIFEISLYQEAFESGAKIKKEDMEVLRSISDQVIQSFDQDPQLGDNVMRVLAVDISFNFTDRVGTFNFARITVEAKDFVNTYEV